MEIVLLERVENLGAIGDVVTVKDGYARNFLLPNAKALRATKANLERFEREREAIEARNAEAASEAADQGKSLDGKSFILIRQAGDTGQLYGSVSARDIAEAADVHRAMVALGQPIKELGIHDVRVKLHPEVAVTVHVNVARTEEEAERQAAGEDVIETQQAQERADAEEQAASFEGTSDFFEDGVDIEDMAPVAESEATEDATSEDEE